jgi:hypothetical protein
MTGAENWPYLIYEQIRVERLGNTVISPEFQGLLDDVGPARKNNYRHPGSDNLNGLGVFSGGDDILT